MNILVTGGAGFLGFHLCKLLLEQGHYVVCLDSLVCSEPDNIKILSTYPKFSFIHHDVVDKITLHQMDRIYHLACPASPVYYQADPIHCTKTCVIGTMNMLDMALQHKCRILFTSTSEVYGDPLEHPQKESYWGNVNPCGIRSCYDEGKRCAESLMFDYNRKHKVDIRVARIFNSYGPHMLRNDGRVVSNFITQALADEDLTIYGDGTQTRSFCYCEDTVRGLNLLMEQDYVVGPINIGNPKENTMLELASIVLSKLPDSKSKIVYKPLPSDDPVRRLPDIFLAKAGLNWEPDVVLSDGLDKTIKYFKTLPGMSV